MNKKSLGVIAAIFVLVVVVVFGGLALTRNVGKSAKTVSRESAVSTLEKYVKKIDPIAGSPVKGQVQFSQ